MNLRGIFYALEEGRIFSHTQRGVANFFQFADQSNFDNHPTHTPASIK